MYRIITDSAALDQVTALPVGALPFYAEVLGMLELEPWNDRAYNDDKPDVPCGNWCLVLTARAPSLT